MLQKIQNAIGPTPFCGGTAFTACFELNVWATESPYLPPGAFPTLSRFARRRYAPGTPCGSCR
jgi:hypothetical protein